MTVPLSAWIEVAGNTATVPFNRDDLFAPDVSVLLATAESRFTSVVLPGANGQRSYPALADQTLHALEVWLIGTTSAWKAETAALREELRTELVVPPANPRGTRLATLYQDGGAVVWTAQVQVLRLRVRRHVGPALQCDLDLSLPFGEFSP